VIFEMPVLVFFLALMRVITCLQTRLRIPAANPKVPPFGMASVWRLFCQEKYFWNWGISLD